MGRSRAEFEISSSVRLVEALEQVGHRLEIWEERDYKSKFDPSLFAVGI